MEVNWNSVYDMWEVETIMIECGYTKPKRELISEYETVIPTETKSKTLAHMLNRIDCDKVKLMAMLRAIYRHNRKSDWVNMIDLNKHARAIEDYIQYHPRTITLEKYSI